MSGGNWVNDQSMSGETIEASEEGKTEPDEEAPEDDGEVEI